VLSGPCCPYPCCSTADRPCAVGMAHSISAPQTMAEVVEALIALIPQPRAQR